MSDSKDAFSAIPFNIYDFFGYIFPGFFILTGSCGILYLLDKNTLLPIQNLLFHSDNTIADSFLYLIVCVAVSYIIGHLVAAISHIIVDRLLVNGIMGYPYHNILGIKYDRNQITYKYLTILFYSLLWTSLIDYYIPIIDIPISVFILIIITVLIVLRIIFAMLVDNSVVHYQTWSSNFVYKTFRYPSYILVDIILIPTINKLIQTNKSFPPALISSFSVKFQNDFQIDYKDAKSDVYWLPFFKVSHQSSYHAGLISNWLYLYGFARNMAVASFFLSYCISYIIVFSGNNDKSLLYSVIALNLIGTTFILRYWSLYYTYFTKAIFRAYIAK